MKEEYKKLLSILDKGVGLEVSLEEVLKEATNFFQKIATKFPKASPEEQKEITEMVASLQDKFKEIAMASAKAAGMDSSKLEELSSNPENFSPENWQMMEEAKKEISKSARKLSSNLDKESRKSTEGDAKPKDKKPSNIRRPKKSNWTKS